MLQTSGECYPIIRHVRVMGITELDQKVSQSWGEEERIRYESCLGDIQNPKLHEARHEVVDGAKAAQNSFPQDLLGGQESLSVEEYSTNKSHIFMECGPLFASRITIEPRGLYSRKLGVSVREQAREFKGHMDTLAIPCGSILRQEMEEVVESELLSPKNGEGELGDVR